MSNDTDIEPLDSVIAFVDVESEDKRAALSSSLEALGAIVRDLYAQRP
jgi:hypothetical protein